MISILIGAFLAAIFLSQFQNSFSSISIFVFTASFFAFGLLVDFFSNPNLGYKENQSIKLQSENTQSNNQADFAMMQAGLDSILDPVLILDETRKLLISNEAAKKRFRMQSERPRVETFLRNPEVLEGIDATLQGLGAQQITIENHVPSLTLEKINIVSFQANENNYVLLFFRDETSIRKSEIMRVDFLANAGHELRTPLASISGFLETLSGAAKDDEKARAKFISIMSKQAERMSRLINDILSLSKIELNEHIRPVSQINLKEVLDFAISAISVESAKKDFEIDNHNPNLEASIIGENDEVTQIITNLLDNAIKYGTPKSTIDIYVAAGLSLTKAKLLGASKWENSASLSLALPLREKGRRYVLVRIENVGEGIGRRFMPRLSERFYRISENTNQASGTGLGLAIVKHIINRHDGGLVVESIEGEKTAFSFYLPQVD